MLRTKIKYEKQRAITRKLSNQELLFLCIALPLNEIYPPTKFHNYSRYSFGDMHRTKFKYENKQRAKTQNLNKQELRFMCNALRLDQIYPPMTFYNPSKHRLRDMIQKRMGDAPCPPRHW